MDVAPNINMSGPLLTDAAVSRLCERRDRGDQAARNELVERNLRLVANEVRKTGRFNDHPTLSAEDLFNEGVIGLMRAADRFDPSSGFRFSTYAVKAIQRHMNRVISEKGPTIRVPQRVVHLAWHADMSRAKLTEQLGHEPTIEQVAEDLDVSVARLRALDEHAQTSYISLNTEVGNGENADQFGTLLTDDAPPLDEQLLRQEDNAVLHELLDQLPRARRMVMLGHYGIGDDDPRTYDELADKLGRGFPANRIGEMHRETLVWLREQLANRMEI